ncbi:MAG: cytochrome bc complex cytochrome b subunit [Symploca sp. SIO2B6]|nr:cytochrome bc complex cytochrome b subunit [Symploca sp. SIO2B6]
MLVSAIVITAINILWLRKEKDVELAGKIGRLASHFPEEWQEYQDWLRDIISSRSVLLKRYPVWQAILIFRWRLFYFVVYVAGVILCHQLLKRLKNFFLAMGYLKERILSQKEVIATNSILNNRCHYILQQMATLLAVAELSLCGIAALTGILIAFYYQPTALGAHESLRIIVNEVANGTLILSLHHVAGNGLIVLALIQIVVMFFGREFVLPWLTAWISGILLTLIAISLSWTAIVLNWEQTSFWRFKLELSMVASIPLVGSLLRDILSGGGGINSITLQHMYTLHSYVLAIAAIFLSITHLTALICQEQNWKSEDKRLSLAKFLRKSEFK